MRDADTGLAAERTAAVSREVAVIGPRDVRVQDVELPPLGPEEVRLRTLFSGISAGTELTAYRGSNPYLHKRWDADRRLFVPGDRPQLAYPLRAWGYEEVGEIVEVGSAVEDLDLGGRVFGTWGHRSLTTVTAAYARDRIMPEGLDPLTGIFSQIGAIALNGVHDADLHVGETVAVFGLGVPGQIAAQLARASGATVVGVDLIPRRLEIAQRAGALDLALNPAEGPVAERIRDHTEGRGADVAIEASGVTPALHEAVRSVAYGATVVALGFFQGDAGGLYLGEEFHHNRIRIVSSQISGVAPERSYRWNVLRMARTVMRLQAQGVLRLEDVVTHVVPYQDAADAFRMLDEDASQALQVVLRFAGAEHAS